MEFLLDFQAYSNAFLNVLLESRQKIGKQKNLGSKFAYFIFASFGFIRRLIFCGNGGLRLCCKVVFSPQKDDNKLNSKNNILPRVRIL